MERKYMVAQIEIISFSDDDIISTSPTIELPWFPIEESEV